MHQISVSTINNFLGKAVLFSVSNVAVIVRYNLLVMSTELLAPGRDGLVIAASPHRASHSCYTHLRSYRTYVIRYNRKIVVPFARDQPSFQPVFSCIKHMVYSIINSSL